MISRGAIRSRGFGGLLAREGEDEDGFLRDLEGELPFLVGRRVRGVVELDRDRYLGRGVPLESSTFPWTRIVWAQTAVTEPMSSIRLTMRLRSWVPIICRDIGRLVLQCISLPLYKE